MKYFPVLAFAVAMMFAAAAAAAAQSEHIRGSIQSFNNDSVTIHSRDGDNVKVMLNSDTRYSYVVKSSLAKVDKGTFIGTATKKEGDSLVALEVVVFPESMRGTGEGHYPWDKLPNRAQSGGGMVSSSMTNGSVASSSASGGPGLVQSSMTNGNIESAQSQSGEKQITVTYKGGQKVITVPATVPVVTYRKADKSALKQGAHVFVVAAKVDGKLTAKVIAVGKNGITPPM